MQKAAEQRQLRQIAQLIETFGQERDRYLNAVEQEVVKLALAVAARILRREAQMDPLLLTGAVFASAILSPQWASLQKLRSGPP